MAESRPGASIIIIIMVEQLLVLASRQSLAGCFELAFASEQM